jgi:hypothetical protein
VPWAFGVGQFGVMPPNVGLPGGRRDRSATGTGLASSAAMAPLVSLSRGITQVEAAMAVALFSLVGLGIVTLAHGRAGDDEQRAIRGAEVVLEAAQNWGQDHPGNCPSLTQLQEAGLLADGALMEDPWAGRYRVVCRGESPTVRSAGPDGTYQTEDDIVASSP